MDIRRGLPFALLMLPISVLAAAPRPGAPPAAPATGDERIQVVSGTYGLNCSAERGDVTEAVARQCNGRVRCVYQPDRGQLGDAGDTCRPEYTVEWRCGARSFTATSPRESGEVQHRVTLSCEASQNAPPPATGTPSIQVITATYGPNCPGVQGGNVTGDVARHCEGLVRCAYLVDVTRLHDPAPGCAKDYVVQWRCGGRTFTATASREAGYRSVVLSCEPAFTGPMR